MNFVFPNVISHILLSPVVWKVKMAENDIAFLLNRGELVEPHDNEQAEVNTILDKSFFINTESVFLKIFSLFS
jgi:hypothetical protein